jgi:hypothetical protein
MAINDAFIRRGSKMLEFIGQKARVFPYSGDLYYAYSSLSVYSY